MEFEYQGMQVEIGGVSANDLPANISPRDIIDIYENGGDMDDAMNYIMRSEWFNGNRDTRFWDARFNSGLK